MQKNKAKQFKERHKRSLELKDLPLLSSKLKSQKKKIVFTIGSFNFLNPGHCRYLAEAKAKGDVLVVGVTSDISEKTKDPDYPLISEQIRKELLSYVSVVDFVIIADDFSPYDVLLLLKPDVFFTNKHDWDAGKRSKLDKEITKMTDTQIFVNPVQAPYFTTKDLVDYIANIRVIKILESYLSSKIKDFKLNPDEDLKPADFGIQKPRYKGAYDPSSNILDVSDLSSLRKKHSKVKISLVAGSFDLLHVGHARFIEQAGLYGDILVVGIPSDAVIRYTKGTGRPIFSQYSRAYTLCSLDIVDYVVVFDGGTVLSCIQELQPDYFYTVNEAWNKTYKQSPEYKAVKSYGGDVVLGDREAENTSSSAIIDRLAHKKVKEIFKECMDEEKYLRVLKEEPKLKRDAK